MNRVLKTFFVWLLLIALPLQGYASVNTLTCEPSRHHDAAHVHADATASHHAQLDKVQTGADQKAAAQGAPAGKHGGTPCHSCQACCTGAILISSVDWVSADIDSVLPSASPVVHFAGHIPGGLERPPRTFLI